MQIGLGRAAIAAGAALLAVGGFAAPALASVGTHDTTATQSTDQEDSLAGVKARAERMIDMWLARDAQWEAAIASSDLPADKKAALTDKVEKDKAIATDLKAKVEAATSVSQVKTAVKQARTDRRTLWHKDGTKDHSWCWDGSHWRQRDGERDGSTRYGVRTTSFHHDGDRRR